jgi:hypothetical protein
MHHRPALLGLLLLGFSIYALPQAPPNPDSHVTVSNASHSVAKTAWEWTDDERIAMRLDPAAIAQRVSAHQLQMASRSGTGRIASEQTSEAPGFVIDGNANPELFLRFELYEALLNSIDPSVGDERERRISREHYARQLQTLGFDVQTFWPDLTRIATPYFAARADRDVTARRADSSSGEERRRLRAQLEKTPVELCRMRFNTLNAARTRFGSERFDEFLYTAVAPTLHMVSGEPSSGAAAGLKLLAEGCHD